MKRLLIFVLAIIFISITATGQEASKPKANTQAEQSVKAWKLPDGITTYELSEDDILKKGFMVTADNLTIRGITVNTPFPEVLRVFGKTESDVIKRIGFFEIRPEIGFEIWTKDKKNIQRILIRSTFKGLTGSLKGYFTTNSTYKAGAFVERFLGQPAKFKSTDISGIAKGGEFQYKNGFVFDYTELVGVPKPSHIFSIYPNSEIKPQAKATAKIKPRKTFKTNFRKAKWGINKAQIKILEGRSPVLDRGFGMMYKDNLFNWPVNVLYIMSGSQLSAGGYTFEHKHSNKNTYIDDFKKIKRGLIKKYGVPVSDDQVWGNNLYKDNRQSWGMAISAGHMEYVAIWETKDTTIRLRLAGDNYKINIGIYYKSKKIETKEKDESDKL
ncbi:MAG: hypothetical protein GY940_30240 [bacterium]|nr:hypothetical protein [bacterium]